MRMAPVLEQVDQNRGLSLFLGALLTILISAGSCAASTLIEHGDRISKVETSGADIVHRLDRIEDKLDRALIK
jgi:hypothetical protein